MNKQRDDKSVRSESSNVSFSSSKLGQMLAKEGFHPTQDFNVPQCSNHVTGNLKNVNVRHQGRRSERNSDDVSLLSTGSATASFSETALGQMLASQGMKASQDFPVSHMAPAPVKKNLVRKILQSKAPSRRLQRSTKSTSSRRRESHKKHQGRQSRVEEDQILFEESSPSFVFPITVDLNDNLEIDFGELEGSDHNPGIVLIDDNAMDGYNDDAKDPECFHDEEPFSGDDLYLVEFGAQGYQDRHLEYKGAYHDDTNATSVRSTRSSPYRDNVSTRSTRSVPWPDEPEKDPYRDNLQACEISELTIKKVGKNRRRVWLWCSIALIVVSVLVLFLTRNSGEESKPLENQTESAETSLEATLPATSISTTTATTPEWQPDIHLENDPRFFHNWTKASKDAPIVDYALHPVRENTKLVIDIVAPLDAGEPIRLHVFYKDEATMSAGDVGCGDYTVQTMDSGATTSLRIDAFHTTQIVVCAQDTVIATVTHLFVDDWNGNEMTYDMKVVDFHDPYSRNTLVQQPLFADGLDRIYVLIKTPNPQDQNAYFLNNAQSEEALYIVKRPTGKHKCQFQNSTAVSGSHLASEAPRVILWDLSIIVAHADTDYWTALVWVCKTHQPHQMSKPVGAVEVQHTMPNVISSDATKTAGGGSIWSTGPTHA